METVNIIRQLYEVHDLTVTEVAFRLNMSRSSVHRIVVHYDMKNSRSKGRRVKLGTTRIATGGGYLETYAPYSPMASADGYVRTHDLIMSAIIGRPLRPDEVVHHIDGNKLNNDPRNLRLMLRADHTSMHMREFWKNKKGA